MKFNEIDLIRSVTRESYFEFVRNFWHTVVAEEPVWNWHIEKLCNHIQRVLERVFRGEPRQGDSICNISPGTTKSTVYSVFMMPWMWSRMPSAKGIFGSYSYDLAMDLSRKARDCILSELYSNCFPDVVLREDQNSKGYFANTKGGYRFCVGVKGSVTGMHGHVLVVDDPIDPNQAVSDLDMQAANRWLQHTLPSRKVDKRVTPTFLVMQRLHEDDATALFLKRSNSKHICLPAEITEDVKPRSWRKYYQDGLMDPLRLSRQVLREAEEDLGQYAYAGQFLQNPAPPEGGMFKVDQFKHSDSHPPMTRLVRFWDKAGTSGGGSFTVGVLMGTDETGGFWVLDVIRVRYDSARRERLIMDTAAMDGQGVIIGLEQEGGSGGKESTENTVRRLAGYKIRVLKVGRSSGDKIDRADPFSSQVNAGNVTLVNKDWNVDYKTEFRHFPRGKYKDQVDASSGAFSLLYRRRRRCGGMLMEAPAADVSFSASWFR